MPRQTTDAPDAAKASRPADAGRGTGDDGDPAVEQGVPSRQGTHRGMKGAAMVVTIEQG
jgi:hypothetical protein